MKVVEPPTTVCDSDSDGGGYCCDDSYCYDDGHYEGSGHCGYVRVVLCRRWGRYKKNK